jgi:hypothetical protein
MGAGPAPEEGPDAYQVDRAVERGDAVWLAYWLRWSLARVERGWTAPEAITALVDAMAPAAAAANKVRAVLKAEPSLRRLLGAVEDLPDSGESDASYLAESVTAARGAAGAAEALADALAELEVVADDLDAVVKALPDAQKAVA